MKYYMMGEPGPDEITPVYTTLSESEILQDYWGYWYGKMCVKFGKDHVDSCYTTDDCINDWLAVHWAVEVKDNENEK